MASSKDSVFETPKLSKATAGDYSTSDSDSETDDDAYRWPSAKPVSNEFGGFNPRKRRRTGRDAKESAALGIFGSDSEGEMAGGRNWKRKALRKEAVSFVASGAKAQDSDDESKEGGEVEKDGMNEIDEKKDHGNEVENAEDDDYDTEMQGDGLGFGAAHGLGSAPTFVEDTTGDFSAAGVDARNALGHGFVPSSAADPVLKTSAARSQAADKPAISAKPSAFSAARGRGSGGGPTKFNPKSFGARMMAKMGYVEGAGLGKEEQGRNIIIEANLRPQGAGLGAVKEKSEKERKEEKRQARLRGETVVDSDEEERKAKAKVAARKKKAALGAYDSAGMGTNTPRRKKPMYMTVEEVRRAAPGLKIPDAFTPILDMTGPDRKLLMSSSGLMTPTSGAANEAAATEDTAEQAAARKVARRAQTDFMAILEEWQSLQNRKAYTELQTEQLRQELAELEGNLEGHRAMTESFGKLTVDSNEDMPQWETRWNRTIIQLTAAVAAIPELSREAMRGELAEIAVAAVHPLLQEAVESWEPLQESKMSVAEGLAMVQGLQGAKKTGSAADSDRHGRQIATAYDTMMYRIWLPAVARAVRQWDVQDTDCLLGLYEVWEPRLPDFVRVQLLEQDIVRRLEEAVMRWEPKRWRHHGDKSTQHLPHLWLFPWLPHLSARQLDPSSADGLVAEVKRKFRQLLHVWEFYRGVIPGLRQWRDMLRPSAANDQWRPLVLGHVLPSMATYVRTQFRVDPRDQAPYLEVLTGEFAWLDLVGADQVAEVLVAEVFPMWHAALYRMLTTPGTASLGQVAQWLQWWTEEAFPTVICQLPSVAAELERGLALANEALDLGGDPERVAPPSKSPALPSKTKTSTRDDRRHRHDQHHYRHHHKRNDDITSPAAPAAPLDDHEMSIRHYVEDWCEQNDLQFVPERRRVHTEGPLYRITARGDGKGGVLAYFKGLRLYAETKQGPVEMRVDREGDWAKLLAMAQ